ncbi:MAG: peptide deformylase [Bacteroidales bacterium]|jgi:peptide deformylase|nr:peptide deformylase [Bacteroidales bacterium]
MIKPIFLYGNTVLRKPALDIDKNYPDLQQLIADMYETMDNADGVGLAAPQIGLPIRVFVVDASGFADDYADAKDFRRVFINPQILEESGKEWFFNEGCLSVPTLHEDVARKETIRIRYCDENFVERTDTFSGICARIILHEYDHLQGKMFVDRLNVLKKRLIKGKLQNIEKGKVAAKYKVRVRV